MSGSIHAFLATGLLALLGAALLHLLVLVGVGRDVVWAAMIHLTLFGWITALIVAVNYHTLPIFAARDFPYPQLIQAHWAIFTGGLAVATGSLLAGRRPGIDSGLALQLVGALLFMANTLLLFLKGAARRQRTPVSPIPGQSDIDRVGTLATKAAGLCLPLALVLLLAVYLGRLGATWTLAAEHLATLGWVMLMITGVAYHVLPRFSGRGVRGHAWACVGLLGHYGALALMVPALGWGWPHVFAAGGTLMACALGCFTWNVWPTITTVRSQPMPIQSSLEERLP